MLAVIPFLALTAAAAPSYKTQNVVFMMADGLRWQELFTGAEKELLDQVKDPNFRKEYWADTPEARRKIVMPFFWSTIAKEGVILGNRNLGSECQVTNPYKFSYPGYSETLCGFVDSGINSNDYRMNPNATVFEWLKKQTSWKGDVAAFGAWDVIGAAINKERCGFVANAGYEPLQMEKPNAGIEMLNKIKAEQPRRWWGEPYDAVTYRTAMEYFRVKQPRLFYISLGESDEWAHSNEYDRYLSSIRLFDKYVKEMWETLQANPRYRGKTTLVITCDHGRGEGKLWTSHGEQVPKAEQTWMVFIGPDTPALGENHTLKGTSNQIAASIAKVLGYDYNAAQPKAGKPISEVLKNL